MKSIITEKYAEEKNIEKRYDAAELANDREGMAAAYEEITAFKKQLSENGREFCRIYRMYSAAMDKGNELIDVSEPHEYNDPAALIANFREYGIERFTFSSGWSSAMEAAWAIQQAGCTMEGMVQILTGDKDRFTKEAKKAAALLFRIEEV